MTAAKKLSDRQLKTLKALKKMLKGKQPTFVNWSEADSLVEIGLVEALGTGKYRLTAEGLASLNEEE